MKKVGLFIASAVIVAAAMTSCVKRQAPDTETAREDGSATITGYVMADLDLVIDTGTTYRAWPADGSFLAEYEFAPTGTKVMASYNTASLDPSNTNNETVVVMGSVGSDGKYSISVPVNSTNAITVWVQDFEFDQLDLVDTDNNFTTPPVSTPVRKKYTVGTQAVTVVNGDVAVLDFFMI